MHLWLNGFNPWHTDEDVATVLLEFVVWKLIVCLQLLLYCSHSFGLPKLWFWTGCSWYLTIYIYIYKQNALMVYNFDILLLNPKFVEFFSEMFPASFVKIKRWLQTRINLKEILVGTVLVQLTKRFFDYLTPFSIKYFVQFACVYLILSQSVRDDRDIEK